MENFPLLSSPSCQVICYCMNIFPSQTRDDKWDELWIWRRLLCSVSSSRQQNMLFPSKKAGWKQNVVRVMIYELVIRGMIKIQIQQWQRHLLLHVFSSRLPGLTEGLVQPFCWGTEEGMWGKTSINQRGKWQPSVWDIFAWTIRNSIFDMKSLSILHCVVIIQSNRWTQEMVFHSDEIY